MRVLVLADTHIPDHAVALPPDVLAAAAEADAVLHAGDVTGSHVLDELSAATPVHCVRGNNDGPDVAAWGATERVELTLGGVRVAMVHDAGPRTGRPARLRRWFPDADLIVFGHSHIPMAFEDGGVWFVNPGSPTWKRREPAPTMVVLDLAPGVVRPTTVRLPARPRSRRSRGTTPPLAG
jgi:putative phosphoesterase